MSERPGKREARAALGAILAVAVSLVVVSLAVNCLGLNLGDVAIVGLAFLPLVAYLALSGAISEITGPGGISAKFKSVAREIVRPAKETIEPTIQDIGQIAKGSIEQLERQLRNVDESKPIVLVLMIGPERRYTADALLVYIRRLTEYAKFGYVVFVREDREVVASMPVREIKRVLETPVGTDFVREINVGNAARIIGYPGVSTTALSRDTTNIEALEEMTRQNTDSLLVVDKAGRLRGIVERDQILSKLMLAIAGE